METSGTTRTCCVIGKPISHTLSPLIHNAAYQKLKLDYHYAAFEVEPQKLGWAIEGIRSLGIRGANITIPHKIAVIPYLDKIDKLAEKIGAVNTVVNDNGKLKGYNTDATGFWQALKKTKNLKGKKAVVLGAGGAAKAVAYKLVEEGLIVSIHNRHPEKAKKLAKKLGAQHGDLKKLDLKDTSLLVNATPVGMTPSHQETPISAEKLHKKLIVYDLVYNPEKTKLLSDAQKIGAKTIPGINMLVYQAAESFELFTGKKPPEKTMFKAANKKIYGKTK